MKKDFFLETKLPENGIALFYLGQVGFIIKYKEKYVLIDGYLSDYVDRNCSTEQVKWVRNYPAPIDASELDFVDYVFLTHAHFDHADPITLSAIHSVNKKAQFFVSEAIAEVIESYGIEKNRINSMSCDAKISLDCGISVTAIPAAHEELHINEKGEYEEVGFKFEFGKTTVFHGGDGCPYDGFEEKISGSDILILPVNGRDYYRTHINDIIGCFDSTEAIHIAKNTGADLLIPTHFDLYSVNCINPAEFVDKLYKINPTQKFHIFAPGERFIYLK